LFKKGFVKIKVHTNHLERSAASDDDDGRTAGVKQSNGQKQASRSVFGDPEPKTEFEKQLIYFLEGLIERMGYYGKVMVLFREDHKIGLKIDSEYSSILIGKKGKNLDALQLLANIFAGRKGREDMRVILDSENYRIRREESLVRLAYAVADRVRENRGSVLLEPMNPFDRRLIHTTLNDIADVETKSEGEGLYKQVRVFYRGLGRS
jgi:spoIIIJ-associated protein